MLGLNKTQYDETIRNVPSDDSYPMVAILFSKNNGIGVNALSLTVLDLINNDQIKCDIDLEDSYEVGNKLAPNDMEVLKKLGLNVTCEPKYQIKEIFIG